MGCHSRVYSTTSLFPCEFEAKQTTLNRSLPELNFRMPLSATKRALIAVSVLAVLAVTATAYIYKRLHRPLVGASIGQPPSILTQLPPNAPAIAYVDVAALRNLANSPLAAVTGLAKPGPKEDREYADFVRDTGFDYTRDLDRAALALWPAAIGTPADPLGQNRVFVIAEGRFDTQKIRAYALRTGRMMARGTQTIYVIPGNPTVWFTFLSPTRIVLACGKNADALLVAANLPPSDPAMQARIDRVAAAPFFAVARTDSLAPSFYASFANAPQLGVLVRSVRGVTLSGQPNGDRIQIILDGECDSMKNALAIGTLLDGFRMFGLMALSDPKARSQMTKGQAAFLDAVIGQVKVTHQDRWVRLSLDITPEMLGEPAPHPPAASPAKQPATR